MEEKLPTRTATDPNANQQVFVEEEEKGISLSDIWRMLVKHWKGIALFFAAGLLATGVYGFALKKPVWSSSGTAIVLVKNSSSSTDDGYTQSEYNYSLALANTCANSVMNSDYVLGEVAKATNEKGTWGTDFTARGVSKLVSASAYTTTSSLTSSPIVTVKASTSNADFSQFLVNNMLDNGIKYATTDEAYKGLFGSNGVKLVNYANQPTDTSMSKVTILLIGAVAGIVLGVAYAILFEVLNTHVISSKEIENDTGVKVIGTIPAIEATYDQRNRKKGKRNHAA